MEVLKWHFQRKMIDFAFWILNRVGIRSVVYGLEFPINTTVHTDSPPGVLVCNCFFQGDEVSDCYDLRFDRVEPRRKTRLTLSKREISSEPHLTDWRPSKWQPQPFFPELDES